MLNYIKGEYLCTAERVTETHPMAKILGDVKDYEDYKQKIEKQRKLRRKTINSVKQLLANEKTNFLECHSEFISESEQPQTLKQVQGDNHLSHLPLKSHLNGVQKLNRDFDVIKSDSKYLPPFKNNSEKYEYLIANDPSNSWITEFKNTKEYRLLYE